MVTSSGSGDDAVIASLLATSMYETGQRRFETVRDGYMEHWLVRTELEAAILTMSDYICRICTPIISHLGTDIYAAGSGTSAMETWAQYRSPSRAINWETVHWRLRKLAIAESWLCSFRL